MCYCSTPTLHLNLALTGDGAFLLSPQKTHTVWFISILNYGDTENVLINHLLLVLPMSYPCHYTNLCPHKPHKHAHTHTHTHTHAFHQLALLILVISWFWPRLSITEARMLIWIHSCVTHTWRQITFHFIMYSMMHSPTITYLVQSNASCLSVWWCIMWLLKTNVHSVKHLDIVRDLQYFMLFHCR